MNDETNTPVPATEAELEAARLAALEAGEAAPEAEVAAAEAASAEPAA